MTRWIAQMAAFAALIAVFGLQIPGKALFFRPAKAVPAVARAAFVKLDDSAYIRLMRQARTAGLSAMPQGWNEGSVSLGAGMVALEDSQPPPPELHLPDAFAYAHVPLPPSLLPSLPPLQPPSLALPPLPPLPAPRRPAHESEEKADPLLDIESFESIRERK